MYVIELDGRAGGMIQTYLASDHPEWIGDEPGVAGLGFETAGFDRDREPLMRARRP
jgi:hypothetical protein